jgi:hypothetical protein
MATGPIYRKRHKTCSPKSNKSTRRVFFPVGSIADPAGLSGGVFYFLNFLKKMNPWGKLYIAPYRSTGTTPGTLETLVNTGIRGQTFHVPKMERLLFFIHFTPGLMLITNFLVDQW